MVKAGQQMPAHLDQKHRQRQHGGKARVAPQAAQLGLGIMRAGLGQGFGGKARLADGCGERGGFDRLPQLDLGAAGGQIDRGRSHPGLGAQNPLDPPRARGTSHPLDRKRDMAAPHRIARARQHLRQRLDAGGGGKIHLCGFGAEVDRSAGHAVLGLQNPLDSRHTRGAGHSFKAKTDLGHGRLLWSSLGTRRPKRSTPRAATLSDLTLPVKPTELAASEKDMP